MARLLRLTLATVYLTYVLCYGQVWPAAQERVRAYPFLRRLLACPLCTGFWAAIIVSYAPRRVQDILALAGGNLLVWRYHDG